MTGQTLLRKIIPSRTLKGVEYEVVFTKKGKVMCDCPGFMYRKECDHTDIAWKQLTGFQKAMFEARKKENEYTN